MRFTDRSTRVIVSIALALVAIRLSVVFVDRPLAGMTGQIAPWIKQLAQRVTQLGRPEYYLLPLGAAVLMLSLASRFSIGWRQRIRARGWALALGFVWLSVALSSLLNDLVKLIAGRPRPNFAAASPAPFTFGYEFESFPSGHTAVAFALALSLALLWPRWRWPLLIFAIAVAASRVLLSAHYLADVIGGALVAWLMVTWLSSHLADRGLVFRRGPGGRLVPRLPRRRQAKRIALL
jgi:membrane-associated phospholipid phosphatase